MAGENASSSARGNAAERGSLKAIRGIRAMAYMWIVALHTTSMIFLCFPLSDIIAYFQSGAAYFVDVFIAGHLAMDVFFLLSSFLFTRSLLKEYDATGTIRFVRATLRRFFRLAPTYYAVLGIMLLQPTPIPHSDMAWSNFGFVNNLIPFDEIFFPHTWSLALEMQFALLWPVLLLILLSMNLFTARKLYCGLLLAIIVRFVCVWIYDTSYGLSLPLPVQTHDWDLPLPAQWLAYYRLVYLNLHTRCSPHVFGALLALASTPFHCAHLKGISREAALSLPTPRSAKVLVSLVVMALLASVRLTSGEGVTSQLPHSVQFAYLVMVRSMFSGCAAVLLWYTLPASTSVDPKAKEGRAWLVVAMERVLTSDWWSSIAAWSYSGYLMHVPFLGGILLGLGSLFDARPDLKPELSSVVILGIVCGCMPMVQAVGCITYNVLERPFMAARQRLTFVQPPTTHKDAHKTK